MVSVPQKYVVSSLFEPQGFKHRGRLLYLCLGLNKLPVVLWLKL